MTKISLWTVIKCKIRCAFCKERFCQVRGLPARKKVWIIYAIHYVYICKKETEKEFNKLLK